MKFYKVVTDGIFDHSTGYTTIKNELLTECEKKAKFPGLRNNCFQLVDVSKKGTFWMFGARFEFHK